MGRGLFKIDDVYACNKQMFELLNLDADRFEKICIAPEAPNTPSHYRKPSPQFAHDLMIEYKLRPFEICYIGDRATDLQTAHAAQTRAIGVSTGQGDLQSELAECGLSEAYPICSSFNEAVELAMGIQC